MGTDFANTYRKMTNDELFGAAARKDELQQEAAEALSAELKRRNLSVERRTYHNKFWGTDWVLTFPQNVAGAYDDQIPTLAEAARPRPIRMSRHAKITALLVIVWSLLPALLAWDEYRRPMLGTDMTHLLIFVGGLEILLWSVMWLRPYLKHRRLVSKGELAIGRVIEWSHGWRGPDSVRYEFDASSGERFTRRRPIYKLLSPGMPVPVFYDSHRPRTHVALCSAFCEVILKKDSSRGVPGR